MEVKRLATHVFSVKIFNACDISVSAMSHAQALEIGNGIEKDIASITSEQLAGVEEIGRVIIGRVLPDNCPVYREYASKISDGIKPHAAIKLMFPTIPHWIVDHIFRKYHQTDMSFGLFGGYSIRPITPEVTKGYHMLKVVTNIRKLRGIPANFRTFVKNKPYEKREDQSASAQKW